MNITYKRCLRLVPIISVSTVVWTYKSDSKGIFAVIYNAIFSLFWGCCVKWTRPILRSMRVIVCSTFTDQSLTAETSFNFSCAVKSKAFDFNCSFFCWEGQLLMQLSLVLWAWSFAHQRCRLFWSKRKWTYQEMLLMKSWGSKRSVWCCNLWY